MKYYGINLPPLGGIDTLIPYPLKSREKKPLWYQPMVSPTLLKKRGK